MDPRSLGMTLVLHIQSHKQIACKHNGNPQPQRPCNGAEAQHSHLQCRTRARTGFLVKKILTAFNKSTY